MGLTKRELAAEAMAGALEEECPRCGERLLGGLGVYGDRGERLDYAPCCPAGAAIIEDERFFELLDHRERVALAWLALGLHAHDVVSEYEDWRIVGAIEVRKIERAVANAFVAAHHRHHDPPVGDKFRLGAYVDGELIGVAIAGRPVGRWREPRKILEVSRVAIMEHDLRRKNVASALYGAVCREGQARGTYERVVTYTLESEHGRSLRTAGFVATARVRGRGWNCRSRPRQDKHPVCAKLRYERVIGRAGDPPMKNGRDEPRPPP